MSQGLTNDHIIVVQYTPSSPKRFVRVLEGDTYEEVSDSAKATTFVKKVVAAKWIEDHFRYPEYASVENMRFHLEPHKGNFKA